MESSPLAAIQPHSHDPWSRPGLDLPRAGLFCSRNPSTTFDFNTLSMKRDYFSPKHVRGSSPTDTLAADLSSNCHIDRSPQLPTPRRSLFSSQLLNLSNRQQGATTPPIHWAEGATTPPIASSSPSHGVDAMDLSPLPHKPAFTLAISTNVQPPTPDATPECEEMVWPQTAPLEGTFSGRPRVLSNNERKKNTLTRPSLLLTKSNSSNNIIRPRSRGQENIPFLFGNGVASKPSSLSMSTLADSPMADRTSDTMLMPPPRFKSLSMDRPRSNGSPCSASISARRQMASLTRPPRKQMRRSLSVNNSEDLLPETQEKFNPSSSCPALMEVEDVQSPRLPHFMLENGSDNLPRITRETLVDVLDRKYDQMYDNIKVIDCRFEHEYKGGHIDGAVQCDSRERLVDELFDAVDAMEGASPNTLIIFHCEYSKVRAPFTAKFIRQEDRRRNDFQYPKLTYPEIYILDGGYSSFFEVNRSRCFPPEYVRMNTEQFEEVADKQMDRVRRKGLVRAKTFAFGDRSLDESPTQLPRSAHPMLQNRGFSLGSLPPLPADQQQQGHRLMPHRMASH